MVGILRILDSITADDVFKMFTFFSNNWFESLISLNGSGVKSTKLIFSSALSLINFLMLLFNSSIASNLMSIVFSTQRLHRKVIKNSLITFFEIVLSPPIKILKAAKN